LNSIIPILLSSADAVTFHFLELRCIFQLIAASQNYQTLLRDNVLSSFTILFFMMIGWMQKGC